MKKTLFILLVSGLLNSNAFADKVLVTIGQSGQVTQQQLEVAMSAAPFATQFPGMDEKDQAYLRGDMLLRMARAEALYQEAVATGQNKAVIFQQEMSNFKTALLAQNYLTQLRNDIQIPKEIKQQMEAQFGEDSDALIAAESAYIAKHFKALKKQHINELKQQAGIKTYFDRIDDKAVKDTVLAEGEGVSIKYGDLFSGQNIKEIDKQRVTEKVEEWIELILTAKAASKAGKNVDAQLEEYAHNLTIRLLLVEKEQQWIPDQNVLLDYFQKHPEIAYIPERRQIGQIVLATKKEAEEIQNRINKGESLFELAGQYSVDPYGKQRSGDMGWLKQGSASKEIEDALDKLKDNEVSDIIKTNKGWHLVVIVNRKPSEHKDFAAIKDRVRQKLIAEKMATYIQQVVAKYPLTWHIEEHAENKGQLVSTN